VLTDIARSYNVSHSTISPSELANIAPPHVRCWENSGLICSQRVFPVLTQIGSQPRGNSAGALGICDGSGGDVKRTVPFDPSRVVTRHFPEPSLHCASR